MIEQNIAAIDIGTNTILMVIAKVKPDREPLILGDYHEIARLGEDLDKSGIIKIEAINRAKTILNNYSDICKKYSVCKINIVCTSALRDAQNSDSVIEELKTAIDADFEIITGKVEAQMSFMGTVEDLNTSLVIDIGGGSTEFISGENGLISCKSSIQIGAVRLTERFIKSHPPTQIELSNIVDFIKYKIQKTIIPESIASFFAVAGTPTTLAFIDLKLTEYDFDRVHGYRLTMDALNNLLDEFISNDINYIINKMKIHHKRADVITTGTLILIEALKHFQQNYCIVSGKGLRFGLLKRMIDDLEKN